MLEMNETEIREALLISQQQGTLVEVYNFADNDTFNVGFVLATDQTFTLILTLDWDAKLNGITAIRLSSIHAVRSQTDYLTTVSFKSQVAQEHNYFDLWGLQAYLANQDYQNHPILLTLVKDAYDHHLPVVIGTNKYKGRDDFEGVIADFEGIKINLHYYNEHDLSSLWEYEILLAKIDYLRMRGSQAATTAKVFQDVFHQTV
ncbi:hypothetical protein [Lactobacillus sp. 3B(2020)]|uniref:hypothetical protein n=1 Tax=Lactobacillus sp. 3B(2020) TaxID=2695882 RepID=UPI0015DF2D5E|nr:hypothetical protein [Lactobacillus sp. 3B(2020)]QLL69690.1 hypothetical protein GTO83_03620 [Lactobacillus sp. 3B(2020)]